MNTVRVFYANQLYKEMLNVDYSWFRKECDQEIYNGAFICWNTALGWKWYRSDLTPVLINDVPKELLLLQLLLS